VPPGDAAPRIAHLLPWAGLAGLIIMRAAFHRPSLWRLSLRIFWSCLCGLLLSLATQAQTQTQAGRSSYNFDLDWRLALGEIPEAQRVDFDDSAWRRISLPRAWNEDDAFARDIVDHRTGVAWYRKRFTLPAGALGRKVFLEFEGARQAAEVFVNGQRLGLHENGITAFGLDLSAALVAGENVVAVRTDNRWDYREQSSGQRYQWADRNFNANYGGLPRHLRLHVADKLYQTLPLYSQLGTTGVYVYARDFDIPGRSATIWAESQVRNEHASARRLRYEVRLRDRQGRELARFGTPEQSVAAGATVQLKAGRRVAGLQFWSWGYGYLYEVETRLLVQGRVVDSVITRTGFRKTAFEAGMVRLNDRVLQLKGYAQRSSNEWPAVGASVPPWLSDFSNGLALQSNANLIRWMHTTPWRQDVESLDRVGLLQALPAGDSESDVQGRRWEQRVLAMRDAIIYHRNNPSVLFYEAGNRGVSAEHMREMKALRDRFDPHGGRAAGSREMLSAALQQEAEYGGEMLYINKSARNPMWAMEYSRDEGARKFWDEDSPPFHRDGDGPLHKGQDASAYNRNQDSHAIENVRRWFDYWRERPGTGTRVSSGGVNIVFSDSNTHHRGAENYRRSGEVDAMRIPKQGFYAHQVIWDGWVEVQRPRVHLLGHWNYAPGTRRSITAISSAERVALYLNGRRLGEGRQSERFLFSFDPVEWEPGELRAVGYDGQGRQVCETRLQTVGEPLALRLSARTAPGGLHADGADMALVEVEAVDAQGRRHPLGDSLVSFELQGPAQWRGGIAQGPGNHVLDRQLPLEGGVNRVLLRSTRESSAEAGAIVLTASAAGLAPARLVLQAAAVPSRDGLSLWRPEQALVPDLARGPTPSGSALRTSRIAVPVASAWADSQAQELGKSYDDDETTAWTGTPGHATVRYRLARPEVLSELVLKLAGWRERSYPLRVRVDGEEVYAGTTPKSLGYVSLPLRPRLGSEVELQLDGEADERGAITLSEVAQPGNTDTGARRTPKGVLSIVEIEFYRLP
jgi:beta-galactosidase